MFRVFCTASIFLGFVISKFIVSDQESLRFADCQLTNTCFERTTDDLANERSTTPKETEKPTTSNTQNTFTNSKNALATNTQVSLHATDESSAEATSNSCTSLDCITISYTTTPISTAKQLTKVTKRKSQATKEVAEESTVAMTTADALKSTYDSKSSEGYTISSVSKFVLISCYHVWVINVIDDFIYILCLGPGHIFTIRAYDASTPHDLLMITVVDGSTLFLYNSTWLGSVVGIENANTLHVYVADWNCKCIWKIDTDKNEVGEWLTDLGERFSLSAANDNHLLLLKVSEDIPHLEIYDQDANLVRSISLSSDFKGKLCAIQKPDADFIVSHRLEESDEMCVSFLSTDGQLISQFRLRETVGFKYVQLRYEKHITGYLATDRFRGNVYMFDWDAKHWNLTDLSVIINNGSDESSRKIVGFQSTDGRIFNDFEVFWLSVPLFWDADNKNLFVDDYFFGNLYQFDTKSLKWSQMGLKPHFELFFDTKKKLFISIFDEAVEIVSLKKY